MIGCVAGEVVLCVVSMSECRVNTMVILFYIPSKLWIAYKYDVFIIIEIWISLEIGKLIGNPKTKINNNKFNDLFSKRLSIFYREALLLDNFDFEIT